MIKLVFSVKYLKLHLQKHMQGLFAIDNTLTHISLDDVAQDSFSACPYGNRSTS